jgi:Icc-related predicted phosphoesterase
VQRKKDGLTHVFFVSDLHGRPGRYRSLLAAVAHEKPEAVFLGGDLMPSGMGALRASDQVPGDFFKDFLGPELSGLKSRLGDAYPRIFAILGNDDVKVAEESLLDLEAGGLVSYAHNRKLGFKSWTVYGYSFVSPTPFLLKDWERYDVSRYVDPGSVSPEEGYRSVEISDREKKYATIKDDLLRLAGEDDLGRAIMLFHSPPYDTDLDRAALDGQTVGGVPLDAHVGSIAIRRFIEARQPLLSLHGHVHESAGITGKWKQTIGRTCMLSAAHGGRELALVKIDLEHPCDATRVLLG